MTLYSGLFLLFVEVTWCFLLQNVQFFLRELSWPQKNGIHVLMTLTRTFNDKAGEPWEIYPSAANRKEVCRVHIEEMVKRRKLLPLSRKDVIQRRMTENGWPVIMRLLL